MFFDILHLLLQYLEPDLGCQPLPLLGLEIWFVTVESQMPCPLSILEYPSAY